MCRNRWGEKWVVGGDFNMVLRRLERSDGGNPNGEEEEFKEVVDRLNLVDLPLMGGRWTWTNLRSSPSCSRITRFSISHDFFI